MERRDASRFVVVAAALAGWATCLRPEKGRHLVDLVKFHLDEPFCGLEAFGTLEAEATLGNARARFVDHCQSLFSAHRCDLAAAELWQGQDLTATAAIAHDSEFCNTLHLFADMASKSALLDQAKGEAALDRALTRKQRSTEQMAPEVVSKGIPVVVGPPGPPEVPIEFPIAIGEEFPPEKPIDVPVVVGPQGPAEIPVDVPVVVGPQGPPETPVDVPVIVGPQGPPEIPIEEPVWEPLVIVGETAPPATPSEFPIVIGEEFPPEKPIDVPVIVGPQGPAEIPIDVPVVVGPQGPPEVPVDAPVSPDCEMIKRVAGETRKQRQARRKNNRACRAARAHADA